MAGPGIRYRQFALQLADRFDVALVIPNEPEEELQGVRLLRARDYPYSRFKELARSFDVVVSQQLSVGAMQQLARSETRSIFDLYDPILFEAMGFYEGQQTSATSRDTTVPGRRPEADPRATDGQCLHLRERPTARSLARCPRCARPDRPRPFQKRPVPGQAGRGRSFRTRSGGAAGVRAGAEGSRPRNRRERQGAALGRRNLELARSADPDQGGRRALQRAGPT